MTARFLSAPIREAEALALKSGERVFLSGVVYGMRDAAHRRLVDALSRGEDPPFDLADAVLYYVGPAPAKPGAVIGPAGPTTSARMDAYAPLLHDRGVRATIGKGRRSAEVREALVRRRGVYFHAVGGAAALIARSIREAAVLAYPDLGPEAIHRLRVEEMPLIVANDAHGADVYEEGRKEFRIADCGFERRSGA